MLVYKITSNYEDFIVDFTNNRNTTTIFKDENIKNILKFEFLA
jgi:hypothetical protein